MNKANKANKANKGNKKRKVLRGGYCMLAIAIVKQAAADYQAEYEKYLATGEKSEGFIEAEEWLRSSDGKIFSFGKGELIIDLIQNGAKVIVDEDDAINCRVKWGNYTPVTYKGVTKTVAEWSETCGLTLPSLIHRLKRGWSLDEALNTPLYGVRHTDGR